MLTIFMWYMCSVCVEKFPSNRCFECKNELLSRTLIFFLSSSLSPWMHALNRTIRLVYFPFGCGMYSITYKQYFYSTNAFHKAICCWFSSLFIIQWTYCFSCVKHTSNASCANMPRVRLILTVTLDCGQSRLFTVFVGRWIGFFCCCSLPFRIFSDIS